MADERWEPAAIYAAAGPARQLRSQLDRELALVRYARRAAWNEATTTRIREVRQRAIDLLDPRPGEALRLAAAGRDALVLYYTSDVLRYGSSCTRS